MSDNTQVSNEEILRAFKLLENTLRGNQTTMMAAAKSTPLAATAESRYNYTELSDADGNVVYPHSGAAVIWMQDGKNVQQVLGQLATLLEGIDGVSSVTNLDDDTKLATAKAVASLNTLLDTLNRNLDDCKIITEGTGSETKYYMQRGADTESKKPLGSIESATLKTTDNWNNGASSFSAPANDFLIIAMATWTGGIQDIPIRITVTDGTYDTIMNNKSHPNSNGWGIFKVHTKKGNSVSLQLLNQVQGAGGLTYTVIYNE